MVLEGDRLSDVMVVGAGPAGMMAAITAAGEGAAVTVLERNRWPGRKLLLTGKGRCNVTNATDPDGIIAGMPGNGRFLTGALHRFTPDDVMAFFESRGVPLKIERGRRVFPVSDHAADIVRALQATMNASGAQLRVNTRVSGLMVKDGRVIGLRVDQGGIIETKAVVVACGGSSYASTGSTGDGFSLAASAGHTIIPPQPSLVPLETSEDWVSELQGLSLRNIRASLVSDGNEVSAEFGEMLFTHYGLSGPIILSLSREAVLRLRGGAGQVHIRIDLKPALDAAKLDERVQRDFAGQIRKQFKNALGELLPRKLVPVIINLSGIHEDCPIHQITREQRLRLVSLLKGLTVTVVRPRPLDEAIVTAGGVDTRELDPRTMESRLVKGLFFAGETIDIDGFTGGYNLQAAFSTGRAAGLGAARVLWSET